MKYMPLFMSNIPTITPDKDFIEVMECDYKGEHYSVRDNGAIMRHTKDKKRPKDNIWTFGRKDPASGYMRFGNEAVHRIVATAFYGEAPSTQHVVDHIDTNRCNNRPTNLRWLTKLENILLNETTRAKVEYICGSIGAFLANPQLLYGHESEDSNFNWMKAVTKEEAANTLANLERLQLMSLSESGNQKGMGSWVYNQHKEQWQPDFSNRNKPNVPSIEPEKSQASLTVADLKYIDGRRIYTGNADIERQMEIKPAVTNPADMAEMDMSANNKTSNPMAEQSGWSPFSAPEFPCCPKEITENPIQDYANLLIEGNVFVSSTYGDSMVYKFAIHENQLLVVTKIPNGVKNFGLAGVTWNGKAFVHKPLGTYFDENGVMAAFTRAQGLEWDGPESIDDYC